MNKLAYLLILILAITAVSCKKTASDIEGKIIFTSGEVEIDGKKATLNQTIKKNALITTGAKSLCDITIGDKNIFRISSNTSAQLDLVSKNSINLKQGAISSVIRNISKFNSGKIIVRTPTTIASIRGTVFYVKVEDPENTYFCDCNGIIEVSTDDKKSKKTLEAKHHNAVRVTNSDGGLTISDAKMQYHTDSDVEKLAKKINETIDWNLVEGKK